MKAPKLRDLPPELRRLLDLIEDECGTVFEHSYFNLEAIRKGMGWSCSEVRRGMKDLKRQGFLTRELRTHGKPRAWLVAARTDEDDDAPLRYRITPHFGPPAAVESHA